MPSFYSTTSNTSWWVSSPYYQGSYGYVPFYISEQPKVRLVDPPPAEPELKIMDDEEFDGALNELLFGEEA